MNIYGRYKGIRDAVWQCMIDYNISELPVDLLRIAKTSGIKVIKNSTVNELTGCESGTCFLENNVWYIVYDDECTISRRRFTIAHELGHIFLGHDIVNGYHGAMIGTDNTQNETEANMFAARLLAPACVLWALDLHTAKDISKCCGISLTAAKVRADRMSVLYQRQKFLTSQLEREVFKQFQSYIDKNKNNTL